MKKIKPVLKLNEGPTVTLNSLTLGQYYHCLADISCANFYDEQSERFQLMEGEAIFSTGTMHFCQTYLEAQVLRAYFEKAYGVKTSLLSDEMYDVNGEGNGIYVVIADIDYEEIKQ